MSHELGRLHVITDILGGSAGDTARIIELGTTVLEAGAPVVQVRAKHADDARLFHAARDLVARAAAVGAQVIVNDRADVAVGSGATGTHVGADDLPPAAARRVLHEGMFLGVTCRNPRAAVRAEIAGADYVGVGPTFATRTKDGLPDPLGVESVAAVAGAVTIPVIAVGGITPARVPELLEAGVWGVATAGAVCHAHDPAAATREFLDAIESVVGGDAGPGTAPDRSDPDDVPLGSA